MVMVLISASVDPFDWTPVMLQRMAEIQDMILAPVTPEQIGEI